MGREVRRAEKLRWSGIVSRKRVCERSTAELRWRPLFGERWVGSSPLRTRSPRLGLRELTTQIARGVSREHPRSCVAGEELLCVRGVRTAGGSSQWEFAGRARPPRGNRGRPEKGKAMRESGSYRVAISLRDAAADGDWPGKASFVVRRSKRCRKGLARIFNLATLLSFAALADLLQSAHASNASLLPLRLSS